MADRHPPPPRLVARILGLTLAAGLLAGSAFAAVPNADPVDDLALGARPGNVIGSGNSLPISDRASNITEATMGLTIAPRLPSPRAVSDTPQALVSAADRALAAGRTGEAQEALERAETRLLSRSVAHERIGDPSADPAVSRLAAARQALAAGDVAKARSLVAASQPLVATNAAG